MKDYESANFKFRFDGERPDSIFKRETGGLRVEKLSRRVTILFILIVLIVGVSLSVVYLDIKKRFASLNSTGNFGIQQLTNDLDSKFSSLSIQQAKLEETLSKLNESSSRKVSNVEKKIRALEKNLRKAEKMITAVERSKPGRTELKNALSRIDKTLSPIQKNLKHMSSDLQTFDQKITKELANLSGIVNQSRDEMSEFQANLTDLSKNMVDKEKFDLTLKTEQKSYLEKLNQTSEKMKKRIESLDQKLRALEKKASAPPPKRKFSKKKATRASSASAVIKKKADKTAIPKPGKIIEQDIQ